MLLLHNVRLRFNPATRKQGDDSCPNKATPYQSGPFGTRLATRSAVFRNIPRAVFRSAPDPLNSRMFNVSTRCFRFLSCPNRSRRSPLQAFFPDTSEKPKAASALLSYRFPLLVIVPL